MSYTKDEFDILTEKYGKYASWAIWGDCEQTRKRKNQQCNIYLKSDSCYNCMVKNLNELHSNYVFIGLNVSSDVTIEENGHDKMWGNFRNGNWDYVLAQIEYIEAPKLKGSYLTDLLKGINNSSSTQILRDYRHGYIKNKIIEGKNILINELFDTKFNALKGKIVLLGGAARFIFEREFYCALKEEFKISNENIIFIRHYSQCNKDNWLQGLKSSLLK